MVQVWTNGEDSKNLSEIVSVLEKQATAKEAAELKIFVIELTDKAGVPSASKSLTELSEKLGTKQMHFTYLDKEDSGVKGYKVNLDPEVKNTIFIYKGKKVTDKFVNLKADEKGVASLTEAIEKATK